MKPLDAPRYKFCPMCGHPLVTKRPLDDVRVREVCEACGFVHYVNPTPVVGTLPVFGGRVLLCRRAIEPRKGKWKPTRHCSKEP